MKRVRKRSFNCGRRSTSSRISCYAVQRLQALCPALGKQKLAEVLARAGLHLGTTTIGRMRKEDPVPPPPPQSVKPVPKGERKVTAKRPNHVWQIDLTTMPTH